MSNPRQVSRFPSDPGPAAWNALLPEPAIRPPMDAMRTADWVVVGGGFTGLSAARRLIELHPQHSVVLLEAKRIADGPSGRNSGFMIDLPHVLTSNNYRSSADKDRMDIRLNRAGIDYALQARDAYPLPEEAIVLSGKINAAVTEKGRRHNDAYTLYLEGLNEPYERLDAKSMRDITGSTAYRDGVYTAGTAMIQPALFVRQLAAGVESAGVGIHEHSPVIAIESAAGDWQVTTTTGKVTTPNVILATNGHLESFGYYPRQLMHIYTYASMTDALSPKQIRALGGQSRWALTPADPLGTTVRRISGTGGERLVVRNRATFDPTLEVEESRLENISRTHDRSFHFRFPALRDVRMAYRWGGRLCLSRNDVPVFGELEAGLYAACCHNGLGTAKGTVAGKLIAELACRQSSGLLDAMQSFAEPKKMPPPAIASLGAKTRIAWGEWRAGDEL